jgi:transglutaminase-like putative cysteine protease
MALVLLAGVVHAAVGQTAVQTRQTWTMNGESAFIKAYAIVTPQGDTNFIALRDACIEADVFIEFDPANGRINIDTSRPYAEDRTTNVSDPFPPTATVNFSGLAIFINGQWQMMPQHEMLGRTYVQLRSIAPHLGLVVDYDGGTNTVNLFNSEKAPAPTPTPPSNPLFPTDGRFDVAEQALAPFLASLRGMTEREQVFAIANLIADHIEYGMNTPGNADPNRVFTSTTPTIGACGVYSTLFTFVALRADIPAVGVMDATHAWNEVYVEGRWWIVDVTNFDTSRNANYILTTYDWYILRDENPTRTAQRKAEVLQAFNR